MVRALLNLSARDAKSSIYFFEKYSLNDSLPGYLLDLVAYLISKLFNEDK